ncbi:MAG: peptidoglycan-binding protein [Parvibaculaceae bacterium]
MKPGIPWSVKGIDSQAREAAKDAARRSGMTLGEWLNTVIMGQSEPGASAPQLAPAVQRAQARADQDITEKLDTLSRQLSRLVNRDQETTAGRVYETQQSPESDSALVSNVIARIDANERQAIAAFAEVEQRLEALSQQLADATVNRFPERPEDVPGMPALETALRNVVNHIEVSEKRTRDSLKTIQDKLSDVSRPQPAFDSDRLLASSPKITHLENRLGEIASRIERSEESTQRDLRNFINSEISKLGNRVDQVRQAAESAAQKAQFSAVQTAQKELREIESRIHSLLKDTQNAMRQQQPGANDIQALRGLIGNIAKQIEAVEARIIPDHEFEGLRQTVEQLSVRVAQGPDLRPLADMDHRLNEITAFLEQTRGNDYGSQISELEQRIYQLDRRVAESMMRQSSGPSLDAVEREFTNLSERVSQSELQLQHLASLEQSMQQLYQSFEQSRGWTRETAEDAASRMGERLMQDWQQMAPAQHFGPSPEVQALEEALETVRANARSADQRNQETLSAIHETLEQIIDKFADLEQRSQPSHAQPAAHAAPEASQWSEPQAAAYQPAPAAAYEPPQEAYRQPREEPALQEPSLELSAAPPAASGATSEELSDLPDDFIAAARRAAQAAAQQSPAQAAAGISTLIASRKEKAAKRKFKLALPSLAKFKSLPKFRRSKATEAEAGSSDAPALLPVEPAPPLPSDGKRRRLLVIGFVLLAVASVLAVSSFYKSKVKAPNPKPAVEQSQPVEQQKAPGSSGLELEQQNAVAAAAKADGGEGTSSLASLSPYPDPGAALLPDEIGPTSLRNAAANGDPQAAFIIAGRYYEGKGVAQDYAAAANWYQKAADKGLAPAQYRLGTLFERGKGVARDLNIALGWYERAAEAGNIKSMHNAAVLYAGNDAGRPDYAKAAHWFSEASSHGLRDSQYNLAVLYERGLGVKQDMGEALFWYTLAARQNDTDAAAKSKAAEQTLPPKVVAAVKARLASWQVVPDSSPANVVSVADQTWQVEMAGAANPVMDAPVIGMAMEASDELASTDAGQNPIAQAQRLLNGLGFEVGTPDGKMGTRTTNAIRLFQLQQGLTVTGEVDGELLAQLKARQG